MATAKTLTDDCLWLAQAAVLFEGDSPVFDASVVKEWIGNVHKWAYFAGGYYTDVREKERGLVLKIAEQTATRAAEMLQSVPVGTDFVGSEPTQKFQSTALEIQAIWSKALAIETVRR